MASAASSAIPSTQIQGFPCSVFHSSIIDQEAFIKAKELFDFSRSLVECAKKVRTKITEIERVNKQIKDIVHLYEMVGSCKGIEIHPFFPKLKEGIVLGTRTIQKSQAKLRMFSKEREKVASIFLKQIVALDPEYIPSFYQRIEKVWSKFTVEKMVEDLSGRQLFEIQPSHIVVNKAIEEEIVLMFLENIHLYLTSYQNGNKDHLQFIKEIYNWLPEKDKHQLELLGSFDEGDIEKMLSSGRGDFSIFERALIIYQINLLDLDPHLDRICDERQKGFFFQIFDREGRIRGSILVSYHCFPIELLRFRQKVRKEFSVATAVLVERDLRRSDTLAGSHRMHARFEHDPKTDDYYGFMDGFFIYQGLETDKWVVGLEDGNDKSHEKLKPEYEDQSVKNDEELEAIAKQIIFTGDIKKVEQVVELSFQHFHVEHRYKAVDIMHTQRNIIQCDEIDDFFTNHPEERAFIVDGMAHLVDYRGSLGLLTLLRQKGYRIEQID